MEVLTIIAIILVILAIWLPFLVWLIGGFDSSSPYPIINRLQTSSNWIRIDQVQPVPWHIVLNTKIDDKVFPTNLSVTMTYLSYGFKIGPAIFTMTGTMTSDGTTLNLSNPTNITQVNEAVPVKVDLAVAGDKLIVNTYDANNKKSAFILSSESG